MPQSVLKVHPADNVLVALRTLEAGEQVQYEDALYTLESRVEAKHKFATEPLSPGDIVRMYGVRVGRAVSPIARGGLISTLNVRHDAEPYQLGERRTGWAKPDVSRWESATFDGYHRSDGQVGTANYWLMVPLVFCENRNIKVLREALLEPLGYATERSFRPDISELIRLHQAGAPAEQILTTPLHSHAETARARRVFPNVDGIRFLLHEGGCGGTRQDSDALLRLLAGYVAHPNVAGATILSLGCQHAQVKLFEETLAELAPGYDRPVYFFEQQKSKSERELTSDAVKHTFAGLQIANQCERRPAPLSKLVVGLECGGSDGFSGISANPAVGYTSDLLAALGGASVLAEFPELCGVEQDLSDRCMDEALAGKFISLMRSYDAAAQAAGSGFDMNPSPGNIRDGLITDAIKSAGAAKKGGVSPITDVLDYTERVKSPGLNLLCTPGNDAECTTALASSGCNIILFTTGLGTPMGNPVSPVIKISTSTALAKRMPDIIDIDAGDIITGEATIESKGADILDFIIEVASGRTLPKAVQLGQEDFIPWKRGVSL